MEPEAALAGEAGVGSWETSRDVQRVADERVPRRSEVDSDLVGAAGGDLDLHEGLAVADLERTESPIRKQGVQFAREPWALENGPFAKASTIMSPDGVRVEVVEPFQP